MESLASFAATIAYGLAAQVGLLIAACAFGDRAAAVLALLGIGAAYVSQSLFTRDAVLPATVLQLLSVSLWLNGLVVLAL